MNSLPRMACTIGALSLAASSINSACASAYPPAENRDLFRAVESFRERRDFVFRRTNDGCRRWKMEARVLFDGVAQGDVTRDGNHGNTAARDRGLDRNLQNARHLLGLGTSSQ